MRPISALPESTGQQLASTFGLGCGRMHVCSPGASPAAPRQTRSRVATSSFPAHQEVAIAVVLGMRARRMRRRQQSQLAHARLLCGQSALAGWLREVGPMHDWAATRAAALMQCAGSGPLAALHMEQAVKCNIISLRSLPPAWGAGNRHNART